MLTIVRSHSAARFVGRRRWNGFVDSWYRNRTLGYTGTSHGKHASRNIQYPHLWDDSRNVLPIFWGGYEQRKQRKQLREHYGW